MDLAEILKSEYPDLISWTNFRCPNYETIDFERFIRIFQNRDVNFLNGEVIAEIRNALKLKFGNEDQCIVDYGSFCEINLNSLEFYQ